eukprot:gb/GEZJ01007401.1/.p1 GENE.gb/GEZJ01007401.1/~~gb/GEZJ01007401.1/.p1  ORF type:complete len:107 (-),score=1.74 gb/GEZJ01007401.1/:403-723(-)
MDMCDVKANLARSNRCKRIFPDGGPMFTGEPAVRKSELSVAQFYTGHSADLHPVASYVNQKPLRCERGTNVIKSSEHAVFRCSLTNATSRILYHRKENNRPYHYLN